MSVNLIARYGLTRAAGGGGGTVEYGILDPLPGLAGATGTFQVGWEFEVGASDITVSALRVYKTSLAESGTIRLWRVSDSALLESQAVTSAYFDWQEAVITDRVLSAGARYIITWQGSQYNSAAASGFTFNSAISFVQTRFNNSGDGTAFPTGGITGTTLYGITDFGFSVVGGGPYTHYRLNISAARAGAPYIEISELTLRETVGGASAAPGSGGTASASSEYSATYAASKAFDGSDTTRWISQATPVFPEWVAYQFTSAKVIAEYVVQMSSANNPPFYPTDWTFEGSNDGSSWDVLDTQTGQVFAQNEDKVYTIP